MSAFPLSAGRPTALTLRTLAMAAALGLGGAAHADPVAYTGAGSVGPVTPVSPSGSAVFTATGSYSFGALGSWDLLSSFVFNAVSGTGTGGFEFAQGGNSFSGTIATATAPVALGPGFEITYTVTGGTGSFAGATGGGNGLIRLVSDITGAPPYSYIEAGIMDVTPIPEPATALLMLGGVAALLGRRLHKRG
jgi:hypothetical protein